MLRWTSALMLVLLECSAISMAVVSLVSPLFDLVVGTRRVAVLIAAIGGALLLVGWKVWPAPKPKRMVPIALVLTWCGVYLASGTLRSNDLGDLSWLHWSAVIVGTCVAVGELWLLRGKRRSDPVGTRTA